MANMALFRTIRSGDRVRVLVDTDSGRRMIRTGVAICNDGDSWVLAMDGPIGTPGVATAENLVSVLRDRRAS